MTSWLRAGQPLIVGGEYAIALANWKIKGDSIWPINASWNVPGDYIENIVAIVKALRSQGHATEACYAFVYVPGAETGGERSTGSININNDKVTFFELYGDGQYEVSEYPL